MVKSGDVLHNPMTQETFVILKTSADMGGKLFQMEVRIPPGHGAHMPPHLHPSHEMRFHIRQGKMKLWLNGKEQVYLPESKLAIPVNTPYNWSIMGDEDLRYSVEFEPAGQWETLFESMCAIGQGAMEKRLAPMLASISVLNKLSDHMYFAVLPVGVQKSLFALVGFVARMLDYPDSYPLPYGSPI